MAFPSPLAGRGERGCWEGALGGSHIVVGAEAASYLFGLLFPSLLLGEEL